jgi:ATP-dependent exoDNAse (exonuclease V) beta subunit
MAIMCRHYTEMRPVRPHVLRQRQLPHANAQADPATSTPGDTIKVMTMHASKGLEFPVVAVLWCGPHARQDGEDETEAARLLRTSAFGQRLGA